MKLEPFAYDIFTVAVDISCVPIGTAKFPCTVEEFETFFVRSGDISEVQELEMLFIRGCSVSDADSHKTKTNGWDLGAILGELSKRELSWRSHDVVLRNGVWAVGGNIGWMQVAWL